MKEITQNFQVQFSYKVIFTNKLFDISNSTFVNYFDNQEQAAKNFIIIDKGMYAHHPDLIDSIEKYFFFNKEKIQLLGKPLIIEGGEAAKNNPSYLEDILKATDELSIDRHSYITAIGGGALLDLVGFAAAIAHRGIRHIRIPTTVLAQNDSGVGVKNGINAFGKKNYLGAFVPPVAVFNDDHFLKTLNDRDWRAGISEAVKVALIKDELFFREIQRDAEKLSSRDSDCMKSLIFRCAQLHMEHIAGNDPFEMGSSRPLDFGHWAAHKIEQLSQYELRHGEAVAIGIALDVTYSYLKGNIAKETYEKITALLKNLGFKLYHHTLSVINQQGELTIIKGLQEFQEHLGGKLTIMLLEKIGKGIEVHEMDYELIKKSVKSLESLYTPV
ncbi:MAG: 3-dehydroquinate synthase [Bacteroidota bacterium]